MPDTALSQPAASSLPPVLKDGRAPQLLEAAAAAALVASYGAVSKGAALKDIGRIDPHMARFIGLSPL